MEKAQDHYESAKVLLSKGKNSTAYYLAGLSVECALKARISRQFKKDAWPDLKFVNKIHSHELAELVRQGHLEALRDAEERASGTFKINWNLVQSWKIDSRYKTWSAAEAHDMVEAVGARKNGVLSWIKRHW